MAGAERVLDVTALRGGYGKINVLWDVDLHVERAGGGSGGDHEARAIAPGRRARGVGGEEGMRLVPGKLAAAMRPEMHGR